MYYLIFLLLDIITLGSAISDSASIKGRIKPDKNDVYKVLKKFV